MAAAFAAEREEFVKALEGSGSALRSSNRPLRPYRLHQLLDGLQIPVQPEEEQVIVSGFPDLEKFLAGRTACLKKGPALRVGNQFIPFAVDDQGRFDKASDLVQVLQSLFLTDARASMLNPNNASKAPYARTAVDHKAVDS